MYAQIKECGLTGSIMTLYELVEGGDLVNQQGTWSYCCTNSSHYWKFGYGTRTLSRTGHHHHSPSATSHPYADSPPSAPPSSRPPLAEFYLLPDPILRKALDILAKQGKAQVFTSTGEEGDGVKFV
jgi:hypothetical protein